MPEKVKLADPPLVPFQLIGAGHPLKLLLPNPNVALLLIIICRVICRLLKERPPAHNSAAPLLTIMFPGPVRVVGAVDVGLKLF